MGVDDRAAQAHGTPETAAGYEPPALVEYGTIEAWTKGSRQIHISIIL